MGKIPEFTRTVLPQNAQYGLADVARQRGASEANQLRVDASNTQQARQSFVGIERQLNDVRIREAQAENTTWVNEQAIQYKKDIADRLEPARQSRSGKPADFHKDFDKELDNLSQDILSKAPSEAARAALKGTTDSIRASYYDDNANWEKQRKVSMFGESLERSTNNLAVMAYRAGQDGKDLDEVGILRDVEASVVAGGTFVAGDKLAGMKDAMTRSVVGDYMEGLVDKNPAKAREILNSRKYDKILGAEQLQQFDSKLKALDRVQASEEFDDIETASKMGIQIPDEQISAVIGKLEGSGMVAQAKSLREFQAIQSEVVKFAKLPLTEQRQQVKDLRSSVEAGNLSDVKKYQAVANVLETKQEAIQKDPWSYYAARDVVADPEAIDFSNPAAISQEIERRRISVQQVKDLDGVTMPILNSAEIDSLKKVYETAKPNEVATLLSTMGSAMKPDERSAVARAMAPKSSELAVAIAVADPAVGEKIILGASIDGLVKKGDFQVEVLGKLESVITDPGRMAQVNDALYAYYKTLQFQAKDKSDSVNEDLLDRAITDIMGPVVDVDTKWGWGGSSKVLSYRDATTGAYVDEDELQDTLKGLTDDRIKLLNGGRMPVGTAGGVFTAKYIYENGRFVSDGDGMYAVIDEFGEPISNEDGSIFRVDARQLKQMIRGTK